MELFKWNALNDLGPDVYVVGGVYYVRETFYDGSNKFTSI